MTYEFQPAATNGRSRKAVIGFWLWAAAIVLFVVALFLGMALNETHPGDMGIGTSITFPVGAAFVALPLSTVGLGFAIAALVRRERRKGLAITTIFLWVTTPFVALMVVRVLFALSDS
jgi:hypothetical protein